MNRPKRWERPMTTHTGERLSSPCDVSVSERLTPLDNRHPLSDLDHGQRPGLEAIRAATGHAGVLPPPTERTAEAAGAKTADEVIRAQLDVGMSADRIEASAEQVLGGRFDRPSPSSDAFYRGYDLTAATYTREARELEAGA